MKIGDNYSSTRTCVMEKEERLLLDLNSVRSADTEEHTNKSTSSKKGLFPLLIRVLWVCPHTLTFTTGLMLLPGN